MGRLTSLVTFAGGFFSPGQPQFPCQCMSTPTALHSFLLSYECHPRSEAAHGSCSPLKAQASRAPSMCLKLAQGRGHTRVSLTSGKRGLPDAAAPRQAAP